MFLNSPMKLKHLLSFLLVSGFHCAEATPANDRYILENQFLARTISVEGGVLRTTQLINKKSGATLVPSPSPEIRLGISEGTDQPKTAATLTALDFRVIKATFQSHETNQE